MATTTPATNSAASEAAYQSYLKNLYARKQEDAALAARGVDFSTRQDISNEKGGVSSTSRGGSSQTEAKLNASIAQNTSEGQAKAPIVQSYTRLLQSEGQTRDQAYAIAASKANQLSADQLTNVYNTSVEEHNYGVAEEMKKRLNRYGEIDFRGQPIDKSKISTYSYIPKSDEDLKFIQKSYREPRLINTVTEANITPMDKVITLIDPNYKIKDLVSTTKSSSKQLASNLYQSVTMSPADVNKDNFIPFVATNVVLFGATEAVLGGQLLSRAFAYGTRATEGIIEGSIGIARAERIISFGSKVLESGYAVAATKALTISQIGLSAGYDASANFEKTGSIVSAAGIGALSGVRTTAFFYALDKGVTKNYPRFYAQSEGVQDAARFATVKTIDFGKSVVRESAPILVSIAAMKYGDMTLVGSALPAVFGKFEHFSAKGSRLSPQSKPDVRRASFGLGPKQQPKNQNFMKGVGNISKQYKNEMEIQRTIYEPLTKTYTAQKIQLPTSKSIRGTLGIGKLSEQEFSIVSINKSQSKYSIERYGGQVERKNVLQYTEGKGLRIDPQYRSEHVVEVTEKIINHKQINYIPVSNKTENTFIVKYGSPIKEQLPIHQGIVVDTRFIKQNNKPFFNQRDFSNLPSNDSFMQFVRKPQQTNKQIEDAKTIIDFIKKNGRLPNDASLPRSPYPRYVEEIPFKKELKKGEIFNVESTQKINERPPAGFRNQNIKESLMERIRAKQEARFKNQQIAPYQKQEGELKLSRKNLSSTAVTVKNPTRRTIVDIEYKKPLSLSREARYERMYAGQPQRLSASPQYSVQKPSSILIKRVASETEGALAMRGSMLTLNGQSLKVGAISSLKNESALDTSLSLNQIQSSKSILALEQEQSLAEKQSTAVYLLPISKQSLTTLSITETPFVQKVNLPNTEPIIDKNIPKYVPFIPKPIDPKPPVPPVPPPFKPRDERDNKDSDKKKRRSTGFNVLSRVRGQWKQLNKQEVNRDKAISIGAEFARNTSAASFKITQGQTSIEDSDQSAGIAGLMQDFKRKGDTWVQKATNRISSAGEKRDITWKGIQANRAKSLSWR
jgi:hypothetical protein